MNQPDTQSKIPHFETLEEEAEFWDTCDTTEFEDEFESIEATFARSLIRRGLTVPLDSQTVEQLRHLAREKKTEPVTLAQRWIVECLQAETLHPA